jgi:hypothetical protein
MFLHERWTSLSFRRLALDLEHFQSSGKWGICRRRDFWQGSVRDRNKSSWRQKKNITALLVHLVERTYIFIQALLFAGPGGEDHSNTFPHTTP